MKAGPVIIRPMRGADIDRVIALAASLKEAPQWPESAYFAALNPQSSPRRMALLAQNEASGEILGFAVAILLPLQAELESIAVRSDWQRQGIGAAMFSALVDEAKTAGAREIFLEVRASNHKGIEFYRSRGWNQTGRRARYYADPEEDAILMSLALG